MRVHMRRQLMVTVALSGLFITSVASAQTTPADTSTTEVDELVVTGTTSSAQRKLDASFSITTANQEQIQEAAPTSTADLLSITPGLWVESTGGTAGANVFIRGFPAGGDAPFLTIQVDGAPIFPPPTLSFLENSSLFRVDDTVERVEVLRGGPSPIFSNGQAGATANFIQRKGGPDPSGSARITLGSEGLYRFDGFYGGPINENTFFSVGGFYRKSDGLLDTQFPADNGGQIVGTLTRRFEGGEATIYARYTKDKNAFYTGTPLVSRNNGRDISEFPGFNAGKDTLVGNELRLVTLETFTGGRYGTIQRDLSDGRGLDVFLTGMSFDYDVGGWKVSNRANYLDGAADTRALFTGASPVRLSTYLANTVSGANGNAAVVAAAGAPATSGTATFVNGGGAVDPNQYVINAGVWTVDKDLRSFNDELRVSREIFEGNTLTVGGYYATYESKDLWYLGNQALMTATPNGRLIDITLDNGVRASRAGFTSATSFAVNAAYDGENIAGFVADEWQVTDRLRFDVGVRLERQKVDATLENLTNGVDFDGNPLTLFNNSAAALNGTFRTIDYSKTKTSWTAGVNYKVSDALSVFGRANSGFKFPQFDDLRDGQRNVQTVDQYEIGVKTVTPLYSAYLTAFYNEFKGLIFSRLIETPPGSGNLVQFTDIGGSEAKGVEFEGQVRPLDGVAIDVRGNYQDATYKDFGANSGNRVARQPKWQMALTPNYTAELPFGTVKVWTTYTFVGKRYSDQENAQVLPKYHTWDAGVRLAMENGLEVLLTGENLSNELGLTEGNARVIGSGAVDNLFLARPIFGRHFSLSVGYRF